MAEIVATFPRLPLKTAVPLPDKCCATCAFFHTLHGQAPDGTLQTVTVCRRYPKQFAMTMQAVRLPNGVIQRPGQPTPMMPVTLPLYPPHDPQDYCGEHEPDLGQRPGGSA